MGVGGHGPKKSLSSESLRKARIRALNPSQSQEPAKIFKLQVGLLAVARTKVTKSPVHLSVGSQGPDAEESAQVGGTRSGGECRVSYFIEITFAMTKPKGTNFDVGGSVNSRLRQEWSFKSTASCMPDVCGCQLEVHAHFRDMCTE